MKCSVDSEIFYEIVRDSSCFSDLRVFSRTISESLLHLIPFLEVLNGRYISIFLIFCVMPGLNYDLSHCIMSSHCSVSPHWFFNFNLVICSIRISSIKKTDWRQSLTLYLWQHSMISTNDITLQHQFDPPVTVIMLSPGVLELRITLASTRNRRFAPFGFYYIVSQHIVWLVYTTEL